MEKQISQKEQITALEIKLEAIAAQKKQVLTILESADAGVTEYKEKKTQKSNLDREIAPLLKQKQELEKEIEDIKKQQKEELEKRLNKNLDIWTKISKSTELINKTINNTKLDPKLNEKEFSSLKTTFNKNKQFLEKVARISSERSMFLDEENPEIIGNKYILQQFTVKDLSEKRKTIIGSELWEADGYTDLDFSVEEIGGLYESDEPSAENNNTVEFTLNGFLIQKMPGEKTSKYMVIGPKDDRAISGGYNLTLEQAEELMAREAEKYQEKILANFEVENKDNAWAIKQVNLLAEQMCRAIEKYHLDELSEELTTIKQNLREPQDRIKALDQEIRALSTKYYLKPEDITIPKPKKAEDKKQTPKKGKEVVDNFPSQSELTKSATATLETLSEKNSENKKTGQEKAAFFANLNLAIAKDRANKKEEPDQKINPEQVLDDTAPIVPEPMQIDTAILSDIEQYQALEKIKGINQKRWQELDALSYPESEQSQLPVIEAKYNEVFEEMKKFGTYEANGGVFVDVRKPDAGLFSFIGKASAVAKVSEERFLDYLKNQTVEKITDLIEDSRKVDTQYVLMVSDKLEDTINAYKKLITDLETFTNPKTGKIINSGSIFEKEIYTITQLGINLRSFGILKNSPDLVESMSLYTINELKKAVEEKFKEEIKGKPLEKEINEINDKYDAEIQKLTGDKIEEKSSAQNDEETDAERAPGVFVQHAPLHPFNNNLSPEEIPERNSGISAMTAEFKNDQAFQAELERRQNIARGMPAWSEEYLKKGYLPQPVPVYFPVEPIVPLPVANVEPVALNPEPVVQTESETTIRQQQIEQLQQAAKLIETIEERIKNREEEYKIQMDKYQKMLDELQKKKTPERTDSQQKEISDLTDYLENVSVSKLQVKNDQDAFMQKIERIGEIINPSDPERVVDKMRTAIAKGKAREEIEAIIKQLEE